MSSKEEALPTRPENKNLPTAEQLSQMACLLSQGAQDHPDTLVKRALGIWAAADRELSEVHLNVPEGPISFTEIVQKKLLHRARGSKPFESDKGIGKAVERYFDTLFNSFDMAMKSQMLAPAAIKETKQRLKLLKTEILKEQKMNSEVLQSLKEFHIGLHNETYKTSATEIGYVLGGADIGRRFGDI